MVKHREVAVKWPTHLSEEEEHSFRMAVKCRPCRRLLEYQLSETIVECSALEAPIWHWEKVLGRDELQQNILITGKNVLWHLLKQDVCWLLRTRFSRHSKIWYSRLVREMEERKRKSDCGLGSTRQLRYSGSVAFMTSSIAIASTLRNLDSSSVVLAKRLVSPLDSSSRISLAMPRGHEFERDLTSA